MRALLRERFTLPALLWALAGLGGGLGLGWLLLTLLGAALTPPVPRSAPAARHARSPRARAPGSPLPECAPAHLVGRGFGRAAVDGQWRTFAGWRPVTPTLTLPQWLALDLGAGPSQVFVLWNAGNNTDYNETRYGGLGAYTLETSADSRSGLDGTWTPAVTVIDNTVRTRGHTIPFAGQRWLRLTTTALAPGATEAALDEVAVYDVSKGLGESWLFMGDSITALAFDRAATRSPGFADLVQQGAPATTPITLDAGVTGDTSTAGAGAAG